ncbi:MAG: GNAT family N-acetyltransferase [Pirellulaceae bacterium]|nr:GNAT family N-acetyltransferase [Pirellulaceae bacterium]
MIRYRTFRNTDPPLLAELWCSHPPQRALVQPMTTGLFEQKVLSKPYFDREGLIVAVDGSRLVGFAHAAFGPTNDGSAVSTETGTTCMLMVGPHVDRRQIAEELLRRSEGYLRSRGARHLMVGCVRPVNPFYLGLYGDNDSPGLLESDKETVSLFHSAGYQSAQTRAVLERRLSGFRPILDRVQMQVRRQYHIELEFDPPAGNWWEGCTTCQADRLMHRIVSRNAGETCGSVTSWDLEHLSASRGVRAVALTGLEVQQAHRGQGLGTFLVGETLRRLHNEPAHRVDLAVIHVAEDNRPALALFQKLGFTQVDRSLVLRKSPDSSIA